MCTQNIARIRCIWITPHRWQYELWDFCAKPSANIFHSENFIRSLTENQNFLNSFDNEKDPKTHVIVSVSMMQAPTIVWDIFLEKA